MTIAVESQPLESLHGDHLFGYVLEVHQLEVQEARYLGCFYHAWRIKIRDREGGGGSQGGRKKRGRNKVGREGAWRERGREG